MFGFSLNKTYLDCIDSDGNCFIVYLAEMKLGFVKIIYSGIIFSNSYEEVKEVGTLQRNSNFVNADEIRFENSKLKIKGNWSKLDSGYSLELYKDKKGRELLWNCHHPKAQVELQYDGRTYNGLGYAETLRMQIKPWNVPVDELRWGRYLSNGNTVVWINWKGDYPVNKIFLNGKLFEDAVFDERKISFNQNKYVLNFNQPQIIRNSKLDDILRGFKWLKLILHKRILNTNETKFKSKSSLSLDSKIIDEGWSLYEIVTWPK